MNYELEIIKRYFLRKHFLNNFYKTNYQKNVLMIYLTDPFVFGPHKFHSNQQESIEIAKIFSELNYNVDILNYTANFEKINFHKSKYDVVFGLEPIFLQAVSKFKPQKSVYYATTAFCKFQNNAEKKRINNLFKRKNIKLLPRRLAPYHRSSELADAVIGIGNDWTKSTYKGKLKKYYPVPISVYNIFNICEINQNKNWSEARKNFLWFGSTGSIHKGLDLLIDIFEKNTELNLYVCGNIELERDFYRSFKHQFKNLKNIHKIGWIEPGSKAFSELIKKCGYTVLLSCSEGMSGSIATTMLAGLVPIVTKETGINIVDNNGFLIEDLSIQNLNKKFFSFGNINVKEISKMSIKAHKYANRTYTLRNFSKKFQHALVEILKN